MDIGLTQCQYWDSIAGSKEFTTPIQLELFARHVDCANRVLDLGCGYGRTLTELHDYGYVHLWGVDFSPEMIRRARERCPYANLSVSDSNPLPFEDGCFDAVVILAVFTCIIRDAAQDALMKEARRVLRKGGYLYINDYLLNEDERNLERYRRYRERYDTYGVFELPGGAVVRHHSDMRIDQLIARLECVARENVVFKTMNGNVSRGFFFLGKK
jgi:ubiquinone/menaquinone biosynthesis C-methylase UbiE